MLKVFEPFTFDVFEVVGSIIEFFSSSGICLRADLSGARRREVISELERFVGLTEGRVLLCRLWYASNSSRLILTVISRCGSVLRVGARADLCDLATDACEKDGAGDGARWKVASLLV